VHGDADGAALIGHRPLDGLPDPPRSIGREAVTPVGIELLHGLHQAYVALLDQVLKRQAIPAILLCDRDDEPEVLLDQLLAGFLIALLGTFGKIYLLIVGEQIALSYVGQVLREQLRSLPLTLDSRASHPLL